MPPRTAERAFEARLRPVLVQSRREDPLEKIMWGDRHWSRVPGGQAWVEVGSDAVYLAMSLRNVGAGMAVIHGWHADAELSVGTRRPRARRRRSVRRVADLYVPPGDSSFWQGAFRENDPDERAAFGDLIGDREPFTIELLYGDLEGGQRTISRFTVCPSATTTIRAAGS